MTKRSQQALQARRELDRRFQSTNVSNLRARPSGGWIRSIRTALGMSGADLARRLGISPPAVAKLEHSEIIGGISLGKLEEVATALDCTVVYALVPNSSLEDSVMRQARRVAAEELGYVASTMALEDQTIARDREAEYLERYAEDLAANAAIWREHPRPDSSRRE